MPEVVAQKEFFHNFTPSIAEILAFKLCLCCQKVDFSGPIILSQLDISHLDMICFNSVTFYLPKGFVAEICNNNL